MAKDANITRVAELRYFASYLLDFGASMTQNTNAFINMMQLKQEDLKRKAEEAENIIKELESIEKEYFNSYASCKDVNERASLSNAYSEANRKRSEAKCNLADIHTQMNIVNTSMYAMLEKTRTMQTHVNHHVDMGNQFLKKCAAQLDNYVESSKK